MTFRNVKQSVIVGAALLALTLAALRGNAGAQTIPTWVNYQGRLTSPIGAPVVDGSYAVTFKLYATPTGGVPLWTEVQNQVTTRNGLFSTTLGKVTTFPSGLFTKPLYLEIAVADKVLSPRQELGTVPFAMSAQTLPSGAVTTAMIADVAVTTVKIADGAVATSKLADGAVLTAKIGDASVTSAKLGPASVTSDKLGPGAVTGMKVAADTITGNNLAMDRAGLYKVSGGTMSSDGSQISVNIGGYIGYATNDAFTFHGNKTGHYSLGWYGEPGQDPKAYLSGYGGISLITGGAERMFITRDVYVNNGLNVLGAISKGGGSFKIDHPLDPTHKYLYHSFVESPDMKNIYDGIALLDASGSATVKLPNWFSALNKDFRYQLTCIGDYAQVYVSREVENNTFSIAGGKGGMKVSWQVTGVRKDPWANAHRIPVEEAKPQEYQGAYLYPEVYGHPTSMGEVARMKR